MVTHQGSGGPSWAKLPEDIDTVHGTAAHATPHTHTHTRHTVV
jgi:hypothetical protein